MGCCCGAIRVSFGTLQNPLGEKNGTRLFGTFVLMHSACTLRMALQANVHPQLSYSISSPNPIPSVWDGRTCKRQFLRLQKASDMFW